MPAGGPSTATRTSLTNCRPVSRAPRLRPSRPAGRFVLTGAALGTRTPPPTCSSAPSRSETYGMAVTGNSPMAYPSPPPSVGCPKRSAAPPMALAPANWSRLAIRLPSPPRSGDWLGDERHRHRPAGRRWTSGGLPARLGTDHTGDSERIDRPWMSGKNGQGWSAVDHPLHGLRIPVAYHPDLGGRGVDGVEVAGSQLDLDGAEVSSAVQGAGCREWERSTAAGRAARPARSAPVWRPCRRRCGRAGRPAPDWPHAPRR